LVEQFLKLTFPLKDKRIKGDVVVKVKGDVVENYHFTEM